MSTASFDDIPLEKRARKLNEVAGCTGCPRITAKQYLEVCREFGGVVFSPVMTRECIRETSTASTWPSPTIMKTRARVPSPVVLTMLAKVPGRLLRPPSAAKTITTRRLVSTR